MSQFCFPIWTMCLNITFSHRLLIINQSALNFSIGAAVTQSPAALYDGASMEQKMQLEQHIRPLTMNPRPAVLRKCKRFQKNKKINTAGAGLWLQEVSRTHLSRFVIVWVSCIGLLIFVNHPSSSPNSFTTSSTWKMPLHTPFYLNIFHCSCSPSVSLLYLFWAGLVLCPSWICGHWCQPFPWGCAGHFPPALLIPRRTRWSSCGRTCVGGAWLWLSVVPHAALSPEVSSCH